MDGCEFKQGDKVHIFHSVSQGLATGSIRNQLSRSTYYHADPIQKPRSAHIITQAFGI